MRTDNRALKLRAVVLFCLLMGWALAGCGGKEAAAPTPGGPTATPKPLTDLDFFKDIKQQRIDAIRVTDWEAYRDTLIGSRVQWHGWILHVVEAQDRKGMMEVRIDLDPPDSLFRHYDAFFFLPNDVASQYIKDQEITIQGDIAEIKELGGSVDLVLTVHLKNPVVVESP